MTRFNRVAYLLTIILHLTVLDAAASINVSVNNSCLHIMEMLENNGRRESKDLRNERDLFLKKLIDYEIFPVYVYKK